MERLARRSESSAADLLATVMGAAQGATSSLQVAEGRQRAASGGELSAVSPLLLGAAGLLMDNRETLL